MRSKRREFCSIRLIFRLRYRVTKGGTSVIIIMSITELVPNKGTASDVAGIVSATIFRKTVKESKIVTPMNSRSRN